MQQDLPVKRKLDLSTDEVETGEAGSLSLSEALTLDRLSTSWPLLTCCDRLPPCETRLQLYHCGQGPAPMQAHSAPESMC